MIVDWAGLAALFGPVSWTVALLVIGLLSRRLGGVMRTPRYYIGFYLAAALMAVSIVARVLHLGLGPASAGALNDDPLWVFLYIGLPATSLTLGVVIAWRYWSWLLAERS